MTFNFGMILDMVVCLCQGVSDKQVREAIAKGASTRKNVTRACGAGAGCGGCHESIREIIRAHRAAASESKEGPEASAGYAPAPAAALA